MSVLIIIIMSDDNVPGGGRVLCRNSSKTKGLSFRYIASIIANWPGRDCKLGHTRRIQTSRGRPEGTASQRRRVSVIVKRSLTYSLGLSCGLSVSHSVSAASGTAELST